VKFVPERVEHVRSDEEPLNPQYVGIFGGTFDPPHLGHRRLVELAVEYLGLEKIWVIPAGIPVHRELSGKASVEQRLAWVERTFEGLPQVEVKSWEIQQKAVPAIDTLRRLNQDMPTIVPVWLMGLDAWLHIQGWIGYPEHQQRCLVAVFKRGDGDCPLYAGWQASSRQQWAEVSLRNKGQVVFVDVDIPEVSSTDIRSRILTIQQGSSQLLKGLVCPGMESQIQAVYENKETGVKYE